MLSNVSVPTAYTGLHFLASRWWIDEVYYMLEWNSCMLYLRAIFSLIISLCNELIPKDHVIQCRLNALVAELVLQVIKKDDFGDWLIEKIQFLWKASLVCFGVQPI